MHFFRPKTENELLGIINVSIYFPVSLIWLVTKNQKFKIHLLEGKVSKAHLLYSNNN